MKRPTLMICQRRPSTRWGVPDTASVTRAGPSLVVTFDQIVGVNVDKVAADTLSRGEGQCQVLVPARWRQVTVR